MTPEENLGYMSPSKIAFERLAERLREDKELPTELIVAFMTDVGSTSPHDLKVLRQRLADDST